MPTYDLKTEAWLTTFRRHLRGLKPEDIDDIVAELRSYMATKLPTTPKPRSPPLARPKTLPPNTSQTIFWPEPRSPARPYTC